MHYGSIARILLLSLAIGGCDSGPTGPDGGGESPDGSARDAQVAADGAIADAGTDASPSPDASATPDGGAVEALTIERWGERLYGSVLAMTRVDRELWIGTSAVIDPSLGETSPVRSALARLDLDTGALRVFEDELPRVTGDSGVEGPTPTAGVVADGARRLVASYAGLLVVEDDALSLHAIDVAGTHARPTHLAIDRSGGRARLWASTPIGLIELDPDTLATRSSVGIAALGGMPGSIAVDPASGAVVAAVHPSAAPSFVVRVLGGAITELHPGEDGVPGGAVGDVIWSQTYGGAFIALASWDEDDGGVIVWDGEGVRTIASEGELSRAARGERDGGPFGTATLGYDESAGVLVVGARIRAEGPIGILRGGGLAWIDVTDPEAPLAITGLSSGTSDLRGDAVTAAAYDPADRRTYVALQQPCSETHIANVGIHGIYFEDGKPRFELPILSGVRDLQRVDGELWLGLRDENGGVACVGVMGQVGAVRADGSRGGLAPAVRGWAATRADVTALDFRGLDRRIFTGWRSELYVGGPESGILISPAIELGTSLFPEDVAWEDDRTFWVAGHSTHSPGDEPHLADVGPRGAARVVLSEAGTVESVTQYVRAARDPMPNVIEGLPSAEVYDVVLDAAGTVHLVCGTERMSNTYDRTPREEFRLDGRLRRGGVARIEDDGSINVIAGPSEVPDGRAAVFAPDGTLYVLDATRGLLRRSGTAFDVVELAGVPAGSEPQTLWVGEGNDLVAGFSTGAFIRFGGDMRFLDGVGYVWSIDASGDVLLLGTDRGLVRVIPEGAADPGERAPAAGEAPPFVTIEPPVMPDGGMPDAGAGDAGMCLTDGTPCNSDPTGCCPGLICGSFGFSRNCTTP